MGDLLSIVETRPFDELPKRNREFVEQYVLSGDAMQAYLAAGYKDGKSAKFKASQMKSRMRTYIAAKARELSESVDMAILGMKTVRELAQTAESEAVRLNAGKELLARAIPEAPREVNVNHTLRDMTEEEIDKRIARIAGDLAIDVTPTESQTVS
jgi:phage terminase small subunit